MSKSIYEEANLILKGRIADGEVKSFKITGTTYCKITDALKQAQKQEKLLELYRCLDENTNDYDLHYETVDEIHNKIDIIEKQIKEKENDRIRKESI